MYLITYVRICKCKDFKILKSVNKLINKGGVDRESFWNRIVTPRIGIGSNLEVNKDSIHTVTLLWSKTVHTKGQNDAMVTRISFIAVSIASSVPYTHETIT